MARIHKSLGPKGQELLHHFEQGPKGGFAAFPYKDSVGKWTIGWGHLILPGEDFSKGISEEQADAIFLKDAAKAVAQANKLLDAIGVQDTQEQFDALVSLIFNAGAGKRDGIKGDVADSTLLDKWQAGDIQGAADQFLAWNKGRVNGKLVPISGLTRRRQADRHLFLTGELKFYF